MIKRIVYTAWLIFAVGLVSLALFSSAIRLLSPLANQYHEQIETFAINSLDQPLQIEKISLGWRWLTPIIRLHNVQLYTDDQLARALHVERISVGIDLWSSIQTQQLQPDQLHIHGADVYLKQVNDGVLSINDNRAMFNDIVAWLINHEKIALSQINLQWQGEDGTVIPFQQVVLSATKHGQSLNINGSAQLSQTVETAVEFSADLTLPNEAKQQPHWQGKIYAQANDILLAQWLGQYHYADVQATSGDLDVQLWVDIVDSQIGQVQTEFALEHVNIRHAKGHNQFLHRLSANVAWTRLENGWQIAADKLFMRTAGIDWPENKLNYEWNELTQQQQLYLHYLPLGVMAKWLNAWEGFAALAPYQVQGHIAEIHWQNNQLKANLSAVSFKPLPELPRLQGISGELVLNLQGKQANWQLASERIHLDSPLLTTDIDLNLNWDGKLSELKLDTHFKLKDMLAIKGYLHERFLDEKLYTWLNRVITNPAVLTGRFQINNGVKIDAKLYNLDLDYAEGWPMAMGTHASLHYADHLFTAMIHETTIQNIPMRNIEVRIPDLGVPDTHEWLYLNAQLPMQIEQAMDFIAHSPLKDDLENLLKLNPHGQADIGLALDIPLSELVNDTTRVRGKLQLQNARLDASGWPIQQIKGVVEFTENDYFGNDLEYQFYDYPGRADIRADKIVLEGITHSSIYGQRFALPLFAFIKGDIAYQAQLDTATDTPMQLTMKTDLSGVALDYPQPLNKAAADKQALQLQVTFPQDEQAPVQLDIEYAKQFRARLLLNEGDLMAADIHFGAHKADLAKQPRSGLYVRGNVQRLNINTWLNFFDNLKTLQNFNQVNLKDSTSRLFEQLKLKSTALQWQEYEFADTELTLTHDNQTWQLNLTGPDIAGQLFLSEQASVPIKVDLSRLYLPKSEDDKKRKKDQVKAQPQDWPALDVRIADFQYGDFRLGQFELTGLPVDNRYELQKIQAEHSAYSLKANGVWQSENEQQLTVFNGQLQSKAVAQSLQAWGYVPVLDSKAAESSFSLSWPSAPADFSLAQLQGEFKFTLRNGVISKLDENTEQRLGMGKLISILSLQTIPRRLILDFSDLSGKGFSFDNFSGDFNIQKGIATTQNTTLAGSIAHVEMRGDIGLAQRNYDLQLKVAPHITASLPIIATIAGGPLVGAITWAADKLIMQPMQRVSAYNYELKGSWDDPKVQSNIVAEQKKVKP